MNSSKIDSKISNL